MKPTSIFYQMEEGCEDLVPHRQHETDAAFDLCAREDAVLAPGCFQTVGTGLHLELPNNFEAQVRPRSGLAAKHGISIVNSPGTIDAGYRGEIKVILVNLGKEPLHVSRGDRIAQLVIQQLPIVAFVPKEQLDGSDRGAAGFGSTGMGR